MEKQISEGVRVSTRVNKGVRPIRFGFEDDMPRGSDRPRSSPSQNVESEEEGNILENRTELTQNHEIGNEWETAGNMDSVINRIDPFTDSENTVIEKIIPYSTQSKTGTMTNGSKPMSIVSSSRRSSRQSAFTRAMKQLDIAAKIRLQEIETQKKALALEKLEEEAKMVSLQLEKSKIDAEEDDNEEEDDEASSHGSVRSLGLPKSDPKIQFERWMNKQETPRNIEPVPEDNPMNALALAITSAIQNASKPSVQTVENSDMKKYMARASMFKDLPIFDGTPESYPNFIAQYEESNESCGFTPSENVQRLQKALRGEARNSVISYLVSGNNIPKILETLKRRFGRPGMIIEALITKAREIPAPKDNDLSTLVEFCSAVDNLVTTMKSLKSIGHLYNPTLIQEFTNKLPVHLRIQWATQCMRNEDSSLEDFATWLTSIADAVSFINYTNPKTITPHDAGSKTNFEKKRQDGNQQTSGRESDGKHCGYCSASGHRIFECKKFIGESEDARWRFVTEKHMCFQCLGTKHRQSECKRKKQCNKDGCTQYHHQLLHKSVKKSVQSHHHEGTKEILMRYVPVTLTNGKKTLKTFAYLDDGTNATIVDASVAKILDLKGPKESLTLRWTNGVKKTHPGSQSVSFSMLGEDMNESFVLQDVRTVKNLDLPVQSLNMKKLREKWPHLQQVPAESYQDVKPLILIGQDYINLTIPRTVVEGPKNCPIASWTKLGWCVHGKVGFIQGRIDVQVNHISADKIDDELHDMVKKSFSIDDMGVKTTVKKLQSREDERALEMMKLYVRRIEGRWEVPVLWKKDEPRLPDNKPQAIKRLYSMQKKMSEDADFKKAYQGKIDDYLEKGYASYVKDGKMFPEGKTWILPHFAVKNPNKPNKIRFVMDAASRFKGVGLNDLLLKGPDLMSPLLSVLLNFRLYSIAISGDIREMFHQVAVREEDRCAQLFLWHGGEGQSTLRTMQMDRMTFGSISSPFCAQYVKNLNAEEYKTEFPEAVDAIQNLHYVDDCLVSIPTEECAIRMIKEITYVHKQGGFEIVGWISNSQKVMDSVPQNARGVEFKDLEMGEVSLERMLGLRWDRVADTFTFLCVFHKVNEKIWKGEAKPSKREILRLVMSIYDPLGFLGQFIVRAKILMQDVWRSGTTWDQKISDETMKKWKNWLKHLPKIENVKIPRVFSPSLPTSVCKELHIFCDASSQAFGSVAYLVITTSMGKREVSLVMSRNRVAPLKPMSIPRMELQAALLGCRMYELIKSYLRIELTEIHFWTDSWTVMCWLRSESRRFQQFVSHRVGEILETTEVSMWHWVPTEMNPADDLTRDVGDPDLNSGSRWFTGPLFLRLTKENWPTEPQTKPQVKVEDLEVKADCSLTVTRVSSFDVVEWNRFSSWKKLIRVIAYCRRWKKLIRDGKSRQLGGLSLNELQESEKSCIRLAQAESEIGEDMKDLLSRGEMKHNSKLSRLTPLIDGEGLMRVEGRLKNADVTEDTKYPIILEASHPYVVLLLQHYHEVGGHHGQERMTNEIRQRFWIIGIRNAVRKTWFRCQLCKNARAKTVSPLMGNVPPARLQAFSRPFINTGLDYFGPLMVKVKRSREKRYGCLFTCLTTRAVHIEITSSLTTDSAIMAVRRFISRRGAPNHLYSDNGTNFVGADSELARALDELNQDEILAKLAYKGIQWHFIPPSSPHMGGCWERMVRSVKVALAATLMEQVPSEEVLMTLMAEAEWIVNSRPLTHVSVDLDDNEALTPNHFLIGSSTGINSWGVFEQADLCLRKQWRISQRLTDMFWKRWIKEYLPTLTRRTKWLKRTDPVVVGDVIILCDDNLPRNVWPKGIVEKVYPGKDGMVRVVDVRTKFGCFRRPVHKIAVLDVIRDEPLRDSSGGSNVTETSVGDGASN